MRQIFLHVDDGSIREAETPKPIVKDHTILVRSEYTAVSAGTERMLTSFGKKNLAQKALERPDQARKVLEKLSTDGVLTTLDAAFNKLKEPMPMGYSGVGQVLEVGKGVTDIRPGDYVAMAGTAYHSEINRVGRNLAVRLPDNFADRRQAALCALGGIALEGIHQARVMPGETVAVIGMGLVGHIVARILNAYGCDVIGFDIADKTMSGTRLLAFLRSDDENAEEKVRSLTGGRGADKIIIAASAASNAPVDLSAAIARDRAIICMIGVTRMELDRRPFYKKELTFTIARSYGPGRYVADYEEKGVDIPLGYVRFTEGRNMEEFIRLIHTGRLDLSDMITHVLPFSQAADAYRMITDNPNKERYIAVLLRYPESGAVESGTAERIIHEKKRTAKKGVVRVGLIGGGAFARSVMLPMMKANGHYEFAGMAATGGVSMAQTQDAAGFRYSTNSYRDLLEDSDIDLIAIATSHASHAKFILEALDAGKHVYCEKPLCLASEDLEAVIAAYRRNRGQLFCGLNRRYAPYADAIRKTLQTKKIPAVYDYIMNAGFIPDDHWTQDELVGGGRIIGEACHIVDFLQSLDGSPLTELELAFAENPGYLKGDNAMLRLKFHSGALGNITYTSMGSKRYPKEQLRVFSGGAVAEMNNFLTLRIYGNDSRKETKLRQDKGFAAQYAFIADTIRGGKENPAIEDAFTGHRFLLDALAKHAGRFGAAEETERADG